MSSEYNSLIKPNFFKDLDKVYIAVSGGVDSMSLLYSCYNLKKEGGLKTHFEVINFEHGLRGADSVNDSKFVKSVSETLGIKCKIIKIDVKAYCKKTSKSVESAARELRYQNLFSLAKNNNAYVATAHNLDDNIESILMHIFRGSGINGLIGMKEREGILLRPLIKTSRKEIEEYIKNNSIKYREDKTNSENEYNRNYIRNIVIPNIQERYPELYKNVSRLSEIAEKNQNFIYSLLKNNLEHVSENKVKINIDKFNSLDEILKDNLIFLALNQINASVDIEQIHIIKIIELANKKTGKEITLPNGYCAYREYDKLVIAKKEKNVVAPTVAFRKGNFKFLNQTIKVEGVKAVGKMQEGVLYIDADKMPKDVVVRSVQEGDEFKKYNGGNKNLSKYFIDIKMPRQQRKKTAVIAKGNTIYAVIGHEISDLVKIDKKTKNIFRIEVE